MCKRAHRPVVVEVAEFVGEPLHVVRFQATRIIDDVEMGGSDCSLTNTLTCQEEIVPVHTDTQTSSYYSGKVKEEVSIAESTAI